MTREADGAPVDPGVVAGRLAPDGVRQMFDRIAPRYDLLNRLMTMGLDRRWRALAADLSEARPGHRVLDSCTGTGNLALELASRVGPEGEVVALDFSEEMLRHAREKLDSARAPMQFIAGDALALPFPDDAFDAATVAFGVRNLDDLDRGLAEMARVVRPGGRVVILEITTPQRLRPFYAFWFDRVVPQLGRLVARDRAAYTYLPASVRRFPAAPELARRMEAAGLAEVEWRGLCAGMVVMHHGRVPA
ncbi:MAG: bifunctional demethylmenaquinone methyltransferase/2-methoxy-6-polyprenyl-1,4-benzoquinol methylase UbiE [Actinomycetota bacterium]